MGIIFFLAAQLKLSLFLGLLINGKWAFFGLGLIFFAGTHVFQIMRWGIFVKPFFPNVSWRGLTRFHLIGNFFQMFLPSSASGDLVKGILGMRQGIGEIAWALAAGRREFGRRRGHAQPAAPERKPPAR